jgi:hypothetical protein
MSEEDIGKAENGAAAGIKDPPQTIGGIIRHLGPGLIIAVIAGIAIIVGIIIAADDDDDDFSPGG